MKPSSWEDIWSRLERALEDSSGDPSASGEASGRTGRVAEQQLASEKDSLFLAGVPVVLSPHGPPGGQPRRLVDGRQAPS
jgi:hypothetical protein